MNTANSQQYSIEYTDFWENDGGGSVKGLFSVSENAVADGVISLDELTAWDLDWTGNTEVAAFSISSDDGSATALVPPSGFSIEGANAAFVPNFSDSDGLDQGLYESGSGDKTIDLGALIVEDVAAGTASLGSATAGSISVSEVVDYSVNFSGFWGDGGSVTGLFSISEADAADGVASLDELVSWSFDWTGNSDVAAFSVSSDRDNVTALLPPGGFLLDGKNTAINSSLVDADGLDQGLYQSASGEQSIDLGALIIQDFAVGTLAQGDVDAIGATISIDDGSGSGSDGATGGGIGNERVVLVGNTGDDVLEGGNGDDTLYGNGGMDLLVGNGGDDEIVGGSGKDTLRGGDGDDLIYGNGGGSDLIVGGAGNDMLYGEASQETILGGTGNDQIFGNGGGDFIDPGTGTDFVWVGFDGDATVVIDEGEGFTEVVGFKPGVTRLELGAGLSLSELSFTRQGRDAYIRKGDDLLAVVEWMSAETTREAFL